MKWRLRFLHIIYCFTVLKVLLNVRRNLFFYSSEFYCIWRDFKFICLVHLLGRMAHCHCSTIVFNIQSKGKFYQNSVPKCPLYCAFVQCYHDAISLFLLSFPVFQLFWMIVYLMLGIFTIANNSGKMPSFPKGFSNFDLLTWFYFFQFMMIIYRLPDTYLSMMSGERKFSFHFLSIS